MLHDKLYVYKHLPWVREGYDPTNGGISGRLNEIDVFSADATDEEIAEWCFNHDKRIEDACRLNKRILWGEKAYYIEPVLRPKGKVGPMFGGNYADTSNATWGRHAGRALRTGSAHLRPLRDSGAVRRSLQLAFCPWPLAGPVGAEQPNHKSLCITT